MAKRGYSLTLILEFWHQREPEKAIRRRIHTHYAGWFAKSKRKANQQLGEIEKLLDSFRDKQDK
jgi:hypothetical protein